MARTTAEIASILREIHDEEFSGDEIEPFLIGYDQLRGIAGVERLTDDILTGIGKLMLESDFVLVPFNNFLLVGMEAKYQRTRKVPARLVESYLAVSVEELVEGDGDQEI